MALSKIDPDDLWDLLWTKHEALYDFLQALNELLKPDQRSDHEGVIRNAELEIQRIEAIIDLLDARDPVLYPTEEQVSMLKDAVGRLQRAVDDAAGVERLIKAATAAIGTWPVSKAG